MADEKTRRQLNLVICLLSARRYLSAREIRATVQGYERASTDAAFKRMFERDKDELRRSGIPLAVGEVDVWGDETGYRIERSEYELAPLRLLPDEAAVLGLAARAWRFAALGDAAAEAVLKLRAAGIPISSAAGQSVVPVVATGETAFPAVWEALRDRRAITFRYRPLERDVARRHLDPWGVVNRFGHWYVAGYDRDREAPRVFRLSRMVGDVVVDRKGGVVDVPLDADVASLVRLEHDRARVQVATLLVRKDTAYELRRAADAVIPATTGWDEIHLPFTHPEDLVDLLAGFATNAVVTSPARVRDAVTRRLRSTAEAETPPEPAEDPKQTSGRAAPISRGDIGAGSNEQLRRLLSLVPVALGTGGISVEEVADLFGLSQKRVLADLSLLWTCGLPGYFPGDLIEVDMDAARSSGEIIIGNADTLAAPLRLTSDEAVTVLVGIRLLGELPGAADSEALARTAAKLREAAGDTMRRLADRVDVRVDIDDVTRRHQHVAETALQGGRRIHLRYHSYYRDDISERDVDPVRLVVVEGRPYLEGWCHTAGDMRLFRLDRILEIGELDVAAQPPARSGPRELAQGALRRSANDTLIRVDLAPDARWVTEEYVCENVTELTDGWVRATLRTPDPDWARRLLVGLGDRTCVRAPADFAESLRAEARTALEEYARVTAQVGEQRAKSTGARRG